MNREIFEKKLREHFPNENYLIIYAGINSSDISKIQCLNCKKIIETNTGELLRKRRRYICADCNHIRNDTKKNRETLQNILKEKATNIEFFMKKQSKNGNLGDKVRFKCNKCQRINELWVANLIKRNNCECMYCTGERINKDHIIFSQEMQEKFPNKFTLLTDYINAKTNIKVRCNDCGFIRTVKPTTIIRNGYCPKCGKNKSTGEQKIEQWLIQNSIIYERNKYFKDWDIGLHYFDFFLPDLNLVIEYNGRQHYVYIEHFHKNYDNFLYRQNKDLIKKKEALDKGLNYLSIKYVVLKDIDIILQKTIGSTTIPQGSRGKCLEIESIHKDEDIVWT